MFLPPWGQLLEVASVRQLSSVVAGGTRNANRYHGLATSLQVCLDVFSFHFTYDSTSISFSYVHVFVDCFWTPYCAYFIITCISASLSLAFPISLTHTNTFSSLDIACAEQKRVVLPLDQRSKEMFVRQAS